MTPDNCKQIDSYFDIDIKVMSPRMTYKQTKNNICFIQKIVEIFV